MSCILLIEDDELVRSTLRDMLQFAGYEVVMAANGKQGLRIFSEHSVDLVITDILMPVMPGSRLISTLKRDYPDLKIIAISGGSALSRPDSYLALAGGLGANRLLQKPFLQVELITAVQEALA